MTPGNSPLAAWCERCLGNGRLSLKCSHQCKSWLGVDANEEFHPGSLQGGGIPLAMTAHFLKTQAHIMQTVAYCQTHALGRRGRWPELGGAWLKTAPVVGNDESEGVRMQFERNADLGRLSMLEHIIEGLFEGQEHIMPHFGGQSPGGQVDRNIEAAADAGSAQELL